ncbi:MAG: Replication factor large subunit [Thermoproteota archaeon]|nr:Replication factor large subunit [Thermoproteota archaeon]
MSDVIGNEQAKAAFTEWLKSKTRRKKAVLLHGPPGIGKTALINAAAKDHSYRIVEMNASDTRTESTINKIALPATTSFALDEFSADRKENLLFLDEVDGVFGNQDKGGITAIVKIIEESKIPIILAANNVENQKLRPLKKVCEYIRFQQIRTPLIIMALQKICRGEHVKAEFEALEKIAENSQGDLRSAINDLQRLAGDKHHLILQDTLVLSSRNKDVDIYETLKGVFLAKSFVKALNILNRSRVDFDELLLSMSDNIPNRYQNSIELGRAYDLVSRADVFTGRIARENWNLLKYVSSYIAEAATVNPQSYKQFELITPPIRIIKLFWTRGKRTTLDNICAKIGHRCHISKSTAKEDVIPYIKAIMQQEKSDPLAVWLNLEAEEVEYIKKMDKI